MKRDYYDILGLKHGASDDEIKKAYRRMARKYHPDVSKEEGAEDRFKEVGEAYEVLKDPHKKAQYDQFGHGVDFNSGRSSTGYSSSDLEEILRRARHFSQNAHVYTGGHSYTQESVIQKIAVPVEIMVNGGKYRFDFLTPESGTFHMSMQTATVNLEPDTPHSYTMSRELNGQKVSFIFIPASSIVAQVQGLDIIVNQDFDALRVAAGFDTEVTHPDGSKINVKPPKQGIKQGSGLRIPNRGLRHQNGLRGNFLIHINVVVPQLTKAQQEAIASILKDIP